MRHVIDDAFSIKASECFIMLAMLITPTIRITTAGEKQIKCHEQVRESVALLDQAHNERDQVCCINPKGSGMDAYTLLSYAVL